MNKKNITIKSLLYKFLERTSVQGISFLVGIVLARILSPKEYGMLAILLIFINIASVFVQSGMSTALVQKKEVNEEDYAVVFYISLSIAVVTYLILYISAPFIADFYDIKQLSVYLRILALMLFPGAINVVQLAKLTKEMRFKNIMYSNLSASILSGIIGVISAIFNLGVWALVLQQLSYRIIVCLVMWFTVNWRPQLVFSVEKAKGLYSFGWKILLSNIINTIYNNLRSLVIGKKYTASTLAYYNQGNLFPLTIISNINVSIEVVMLPVLSSQQDNKFQMKSTIRKSVRISTLLIFPMMVGLGVVAKNVVIIILTEKWLPCVPFLQLLCIVYAFWPYYTANLQTIKALGRGDIYLKLEIIKKIYGIIVLAIAVIFFDTVMAIVIGAVLTIPIEIIINAVPVKKLIDYGYAEQIKDILPSFVIACIMGVVVYMVSFLSLNVYIMLLLQIFVGIVTYILLCVISKNESFFYVLNIMKDGYKKIKK